MNFKASGLLGPIAVAIVILVGTMVLGHRNAIIIIATLSYLIGYVDTQPLFENDRNGR